MDLHADPVALQRGADRLGVLAGDVEALADRLDRLAVDGHRARPGGVANRCAALVAALRSDAVDLSECETLLRQDRSGILAGETDVLARLAELDRRLRGLSGTLPGNPPSELPGNPPWELTEDVTGDLPGRDR